MLFQKIIITSVLFLPLFSWAEDFSPRLYKASYKGVESYLFGTVHIGIGPEELPPSVIECLLKTEQAYLEIGLDRLSEMREVLGNFSQKVDQVAQSEEMDSEREQALYKKLIGLKIHSNLSEYLSSDTRKDERYWSSTLKDMPYYYSQKILIDLLLGEFLADIKGENYVVKTLDTKELLKASRTAQYRALGYSEEAIAALLGETKPTEEQTADPNNYGDTIDTLVDVYSSVFEQIPELIELYKSGNEFEESDYNFSRSDYGLAIRNASWVMRLVPEMKKRPTAVVVGAAHLYGSKGLIQKLKKFGFKIERIQENL